MKRLDSRSQKVATTVRPECLRCPEFRDAMQNLQKYDLHTPQELGASALRLCVGKLSETLGVHNDGSTFDAFELYEAGLCEFGKAKHLEDAIVNMMRYVPGTTRAEAYNALCYTPD
jgi:hypothetical protein